MKIYTITNIKSNICEVETEVFINYNKAINRFNIIKEEYNKAIKEAYKNDGEPGTEEYLLDKYNKHISYDDGEYFRALDFNTHEV